MGVFGSGGHSGHERVVFHEDRRSGLRAIVAIYSTALGPALGGTRFHPYPTEEAALEDVLDLSRAMAYKNATAGLPLGGGKAVIWGDPEHDKSEPLLRAYGRFVQSLGGRYYTACDVGTYVQDMDVVAKETRFVTGRSESHGGAGDSSVLTAYGVFQGMRAAAEAQWGHPMLAGRRVGLAGLGKVGKHLVTHLLDDGASVVATDVSERALSWARDTHPQVDLVPDVTTLITSDIDIYAPCALGGALDDDTVAVLRAKVVAGAANNQLAHPGVEKLLADRGVLYAPCALGGALDDDTVAALRATVVAGAANNQLAHPGVEKVLAERGILYAPDYVVNSGGVIQVADEIEGFNFARAKARAGKIYDTTKQILLLAQSEGVPPAVAADRLAERRMSEVSRLRSILL